MRRITAACAGEARRAGLAGGGADEHIVKSFLGLPQVQYGTLSQRVGGRATGAVRR